MKTPNARKYLADCGFDTATPFYHSLVVGIMTDFAEEYARETLAEFVSANGEVATAYLKSQGIDTDSLFEDRIRLIEEALEAMKS